MCFEDPWKNGLPVVSVLLSELVEAVSVTCMQDFFTGLLETGFKGKQGKYVKPLLIDH